MPEPYDQDAEPLDPNEVHPVEVWLHNPQFGAVTYTLTISGTPFCVEGMINVDEAAIRAWWDQHGVMAVLPLSEVLDIAHRAYN